MGSRDTYQSNKKNSKSDMQKKMGREILEKCAKNMVFQLIFIFVKKNK